ncbi:MAG: hypothetical protein U5Q44_11070 [Dehalococcoidia bacterium]|nr:hypothetical protein [Dehalococcoidia bacterium]
MSCGSAQSTSVGQVSRFELWIEPAIAKTGCGAPGREFAIFVQGEQSEATVTWGGPTEELVQRGVEATTVSPDPGPVVVQALSPGWNNIGHLEEPGEVPSALDYLPSSWEAAYAWHAGLERYMRLIDGAPSYANTWEEVETYDAYWVHVSGSANPGSVNPDPEPGRSIVLDEGWNNFVYTGSSQKVDEALADLDGAYDAVYRYDNGSGDWDSYFPGHSNIFNTVGGLLKMQVYWVHMTRDGILEMD